MGSEAVEILKLKRYIHCYFTGREKYGLKNKERRKRMESLKIFCAGVAGKLADEAVGRLETMYPDIKVELTRGGSTAGVNRLLSGDIFDVMILADNSNIDQMLMPSYVDGYFIWGGNEMVIMGNDITDENWKEKLLDPRAVITHRNPYDDPGGYRAVMALKLSEKIEKGLSERIFSNPGYKGLDRAQYVRKEPPPFWGGKPPEKRDAPKGISPMNAGHYDIIYKSAPVGMGYKDFYSLANNTYWYVNEYEGLDLYKFLRYVGMPSVEELGEDASETYVTFRASDGFASAEKFDVLTLSDPDNFGYYKKSSADLNDGKYVSNAADLVKTGYPVLLAYGVNNYPYTITADDPGYLSGLSNNGGPMRIIFGKKEYSHVNGSNQIQYLSEIAVGSNILYNTHAYTKDADHKELRDEEINIVVNNIDGSKLTDKKMSVRDIEDLIYGEDTSAKDAGEAKEKGVYEVKNGDKYESDVYEGVSLEYFLSDVIGIPGTNGTVTFSDGKNEIKLELTDLFKKGYNTEKGIDGQASILAFAKNGAPLVKNEKSKGYVASRKLSAVSKTDPISYKVENKGGPLAVLIPSSDEKKANGKAVFNVKTITVNVEPDKYAHLSGDSVKYAEETIKFYGDGLTKSVEYKVSDIEGMQKLAKTLDFSILDGKGSLKNERYRGIGLYDLMMGVGVNYNAHEVILHARDGSTMTFPLSDIRKKDYKNFADKNYKDPLAPFIAYGQGDVKKALKEGAPLTAESGGPLKFIMPQANDKTQNAKLCIKDIAAVEVTAIEMESWGHASNDIYSDFLSYEFEVVVKNDTNEWSKKLTLRELEEMEDCVTRSDYTVLDLGTCEGIDIWKLVKAVAGDIPGVDNPVAVTGFANDGYSKDFLSIFYEDGVKNGVPDANGNRKPILLCYAIGGYPLVDSEDHEGYTSLVGNAFGPLRFITETNQGASIKYASKLVVTISGSGEIK